MKSRFLKWNQNFQNDIEILKVISVWPFLGSIIRSIYVSLLDWKYVDLLIRLFAFYWWFSVERWKSPIRIEFSCLAR